MISASTAWHDFTNTDFHCWPLTASSLNPTALASCPGVALDWVEPPPTEIKAEEAFNVTYDLILDSTFYDWAVDTSGGQTNYFSTIGFTNGSEAKYWCETTICPSASADVTINNCCIHHVNVHSCPLVDTSYCGPWISPSGDIYTHSAVLWGAASTTRWTSIVGGLYVEGTTQMIAHFKVANMQMALFFDILVKPRSECGNNICETEDGEDCSVCPADCGKCPFKLETWQLTLIIIGALVLQHVEAVTLTVYQFTTYQQRKLLWDESWIVTHEEIQRAMSKKAVFGSSLSLAAINSSNAGLSNMQASAAARQVFTKVTVINGKSAAVRSVCKTQFTLTKQVRQEVKTLRSIDHHNVCKFVAACLDPEKFCIMMEYCPKGSLADVLQNPDVPLNWGFRFSMASDVARGMIQLHTHHIIHGRLSSNNCVIDDRWTVKITDLDGKSRQDERDDAFHKERLMQVYKPPECYEKGYTIGPEADSYAFGIILVELATRNDAYGVHDEDTYDLSETWKPDLPELEDEVDKDMKCPSPVQYNQLIAQCISDNAHTRPTFEVIKRMITKMNPSIQSPVDLMMNMMEKYSKHLEAVVGERTADLVVEKQKTDRLLYSMLPKPVADDLRVGKTIACEQFDVCTIYFSDIVGFTVISSKSTPFEIVGLLNKLYTTFDSIIEKYDVYKVETIGDAYMVVSGVPQRNGDRHASETAGMAVDLVAASEVFVIPHMPKEPLKIRVGMHSGPVCAGVVGLKMPRYCLFGDTVNTASRMESNGEAYRIHMSNPTYEVLKKCGGFKMEERGVIPVKGKGDMRTWWLTGRMESQVDKVKQATSLAEDQQRKISATDSGYNEVSPASTRASPSSGSKS
ncbi:hypothetical protein CAPTEDRAFT_165186 [Capitella teleta]|uniref:Guanylate cyclase n=1 Tax=Capitella teleta TaxID=283909 RepID=R7V6G8_CAPTE|nr:hypothetical protein CAPTEDRAFT_165186 [Capitella teleta]|eukprot:ELU11951.1 hypothetical protein CAPTEDRAFT_165186 [Capitella teleta]